MPQEDLTAGTVYRGQLVDAFMDDTTILRWLQSHLMDGRETEETTDSAIGKTLMERSVHGMKLRIQY